jgi:hypothetical protein
MQCGALPNLRARDPMKLHPLDVSPDGFSDCELNAGLMLLAFETIFMRELLRLFIADCVVLEVISNAKQHYAIALAANIAPR